MKEQDYGPEPDGEEPITLKSLTKQAFAAGDVDLADFYLATDRELTILRALGKVVGRMYQKGGLNDENWQALFEALSDAGLLDE